MKTLLSQFCEEFGAAVSPLLGPLKDFGEVLSSVGEAGLLPPEQAGFVAGFHDVSHQLRTLALKVEEQQAYVLIFGPLKSGKSTLMNSIAAAYVSEVTALPAYPCMVYVSHAAEREFLVSRYNGETQTFTSPASMRMQVTRDHAELADRLRREEERGRDFDPAVHFPEAIRRIDVRVPAEELKHSGAVLVDTPGLYSRMKFGYDRMTREFRNAAACAIFVVKTDNLFLEQVFAEFQDLLQLFSRIFLVVNLDTTKMDLRPDGSLAPSLEREDPVRIIQAFETLSMSSPLKSAVEEGRLRIYPVDLLRAGAQRLQATERPEGGAGTPANDFGAFLGDLTDYLNSTDYLLAFLGDSLRHADHLMAEGQRLCHHPGVMQLVRRGQELERERDLLRSSLGALERVESTDWDARFAGLTPALIDAGGARATELGDRTHDQLRSAVRGWFTSDEGLGALVDRDATAAFDSFQNEWGSEVESQLKARVQGAGAGAELDAELERDLGTLKLDLADFANEGLISVLPRAAVRRQGVALDMGQVPVRKGLLDWLLLRTKNSLRKKLFGAEGQAGPGLTRAMKAKRLGEAGAQHFEAEFEAAAERFLPAETERIAQTITSDYAATVRSALDERFGARRREAEQRLGQIEGQLARLAQVSRGLSTLEDELERGGRQIAELTERYGEADPAELVRELMPVESLEIEDEPAVEDERPANPAVDVQP